VIDRCQDTRHSEGLSGRQRSPLCLELVLRNHLGSGHVRPTTDRTYDRNRFDARCHQSCKQGPSTYEPPHHSGPERLAKLYSVKDFHLLSFTSSPLRACSTPTWVNRDRLNSAARPLLLRLLTLGVYSQLKRWAN
jgi:hypothetical protein